MADIVRMVQARVDPRVIKAYIKHSQIAYKPSAQEIVAFKKLGMPNDILVALINRGTELKQTSMQATGAPQGQVRQAPSPSPNYGTPPLYGGMSSAYWPYPTTYPGLGYYPYYPNVAGLPITAITSVNSSVPLYSVNGQPVYSGFYPTIDPTAYGLFGTFNNSYPTYINGAPVYSAYFVPGYGYIW